MITETPQVVEAITGLQNNRDFKLIIDWIQQSLNDRLDSCARERDDIELRRHQGAAQELRELLQAVEDAQKHLHKLRSQT